MTTLCSTLKAGAYLLYGKGDSLQLGAMNNPHNNLEDEIKKIGEFKFDYLELTIEWPNATAEIVTKNKKKLQDLLSTYKFKQLLTHAPWYFPISHPYDSLRDSTIQEFEKIIVSASNLGAKLFTMHTEPFPYYHKNRKLLIDLTIDTISKLAKSAENNGITLLIENYNNQSFSAEDFKLLFSKVPSLGMTLDLGHANTIKPRNEGIHEYLDTFKKEIQHVHAHDNKGVTDEHLPLGVGTVDWKQTAKKIKSINYNKTITLEVHAPEVKYLGISKEKLESLL